ncbi:MAG: PrsW family intramembrane metalloprotease [Planctomycetes bacterium]|nr:PrsW family intramembrane metalloprotease [Planctomycetota bacterium]
MIVRCLACEGLFEGSDDSEEKGELCPACAGTSAPAAGADFGPSKIRVRCPACGLERGVPVYRQGENIRCAQCRVFFPAAPVQTEKLPEPSLEDAGDVPAGEASTGAGLAGAPPPESLPVPRLSATELPDGAAASYALSASGLSITGRDSPLWRLRWAAPLLLLPLAWVVVSPPESAGDRLRPLLLQHPDIAELLVQNPPREAFFPLLPDRRVPGAFLAYDSWAHFALAAAAAVLALLYLGMAWPRGRAPLRHLVGVSALTATAGCMLVFAIQFVAEVMRHMNVVGGGLLTLILALLKFIGLGYERALDPDAGFLESFAGFTIGAGLCEEVCKLLPVVVHLRSAERPLDWRGTAAWGLACGLGLGITEGLLYSSDHYNGVEVAGVYAVRFVSLVFLHGVWTGIAALRLYRSPGTILGVSAWYEWIPAILWALVPSAGMHGLYDTLLKKEHTVLALGIAAVSLALFLRQYERTRARQRLAVARLPTRAVAQG